MAKAGEPLLKVNLYLYHSDVLKLRHHLGHGWTAEVREWVRERTRGLTQPSREYEPYTLEDLDAD